LIYKDTVVQYTGLTDDKGAKIFEGDILKNEFDVIGAVYWHKETAGFYAGGGARPVVSLVHNEEDEVIGNIHNTPELLGVEKGGENGL
jgi:hypothetical protein